MTNKKQTADDLQLWFDVFENTPEEQNALKAFIEKEKAMAREEERENLLEKYAKLEEEAQLIGRQEAAKELLNDLMAKAVERQDHAEICLNEKVGDYKLMQSFADEIARIHKILTDKWVKKE